MSVSRLHMYRGRTERKRKALHMLMLSGVVRPSHIALRYTSLVPQIEEQTEGSQHNALSPTHLSNQLYRFIKSVQKRLTQLLSLEPTYVKHSVFKPRRVATSKMCLRS
ncbi:hypothetical protein [Nitrospira sp. BLG_1]|uniref:hypothetical protein n=1 Tax=Nitrospira sp. BLG_1 TaxID=3395883 RepID=UPI0039BCB288